MKVTTDLFKPARSANRPYNLLKTFVQTLAFWTTFLYLLPKAIVWFERYYGLARFEPNFILGISLFILFGALGLYSGFTMSWLGKGTPLPTDCPVALVVKGPYKFVRNPMAVAGIGQGLCVGLCLGSYFVMAYSLLGAFLWHLYVRPMEELDLEKRFGASYLAYKSKTRCWVPRFS